MRVVFFGTPEVATPSLRMLLAGAHEVAAVVTQPDRVRGRGREVSASPVKQVAIAEGIPTLQPQTPKEDGFVEALQVFEPEAFAVVAYGHILPLAVLEVAPAVNVHFSLLPAYRGAAPVQRALMDGVARTGVSVFLLEPTVDTGPVLATAAIDVSDTDTAGDLFDKLAPIGAGLLLSALEQIAMGTADGQVQDPSLASPAPKIKPEEALIDWARPARETANRIRALNPRPGAYTTFDAKRLTLWRAHLLQGPAGEPGTVVIADKTSLVVAAGDGCVALDEVQLEGKRPISGAELVRGYRIEPGVRLGHP
jgi:methionyl-tRNA formyltransferase